MSITTAPLASFRTEQPLTAIFSAAQAVCARKSFPLAAALSGFMRRTATAFLQTSSSVMTRWRSTKRSAITRAPSTAQCQPHQRRSVLHRRKNIHTGKDDGENSLHGGPTGFSYRLWSVKDASETAEGPSVTFSYESADGEEGFPGNLSVEVTYTVTNENDLRIAYRAKTDKATALNLTNHSFFNLSGDASKPIFHQELQINADAITAASDDLIPTGKLTPVAGTPYDFNEPKEIGRDMFADDHLLQVCGGYDHNFVLRGEGMRKAAEAYDKESGRVMEVYTDQPGMQLYTANSLSGAGVDGVPLCGSRCFLPGNSGLSGFPASSPIPVPLSAAR